MSLILLIETATTSCSVALANTGKIIGLREINQRNVHAEVITIYIDELFKETAKHYSQLSAIAVSSGPGSYTGLRIGVSTAKGLGFSLDKPLVAIETLNAMAHGLIGRGEVDIDNNTLLCPMIDARRMEVYTALFDHSGKQVKPTAAEIIDENSFAELLINHKIIFFGDGADKCREALGHQPNATFILGFSNSAKDLLTPALAKLSAQQFEDIAYFEPYYLKDFIAGVKKT
ncbi:tRNA (adenosine(37)-N6)-threonylcarbamoyltransferase complex dimerization subunit type 1 TsaB [Mucilaginibacter sp. PPCGB 2223]|uniref:tRNA (adenosine(37)-N6)-threonylcarbamoyltransferase complex dimerization subunit type 1 TsaB n=1 Tax=Mucilaginibacter sp. PPCGB 2223 TaxID=1886027 RepID=UPI0008241CC6|nr:tRNA (adenosine(37)-N6)-threonylcarbamoyltransferase complex dimerization subunit type 1 TsaB [Mucilaginibacter sp. PPCGB 2223]OCX52855.1 tRNA (adenosine(37)-N6)-threonylcarbamoyltransferase complex dimerization subunit type 1 TsaB [Mucilaginibacter sp. PPCGB 2223]